MRLWINNVGIIKDSSIIVDGLTVITGKNNSGKTTVGKLLYSLIQANCNTLDAFENSRVSYLTNQIQMVAKVFLGQLVLPLRMAANNQTLKPLLEENIILSELSKSFTYRNEKNSEELLRLIRQIKESLVEITFPTVRALLNDLERFVIKKDYLDSFETGFNTRKSEAIEICEKTIMTLEDSDLYTLFVRDRIKAYLNLMFHDQVKPVRNNRVIARIKTEVEGKTIFDLKIRSKTNCEFIKETLDVFPYSQAIFIDDPFALDSIVPETNYKQGYYTFHDTIVGFDIRGVESYRDHLVRLITKKSSDDFFDELSFQKQYKSVFEQINRIVPGEFQETSDGFFYVDNGSRLNVQNLATGSKLFFIIKLLLMNGHLNKKTLVILDEPESHLHPEWINKFAEVLAVMIKEIGIHVLITTHSPNLLLALNVYAHENNIDNHSHFYLAKKKEESWNSRIECIDGNPNEGYAHLSIPLIEMSMRQDT